MSNKISPKLKPMYKVLGYQPYDTNDDLTLKKYREEIEKRERYQNAVRKIKNGEKEEYK